MDSLVLKKIETFFSPHRPLTYKKGKVILQNFDPLSHIFYFQKGLVRQCVITNEGEEITIHFFKPPSFFPIMLALSQEENRYTFIAATNAVVRKAPVEAVLLFLKKEL